MVSIGPRPFGHGNSLEALEIEIMVAINAFQLGHVLSDMEIDMKRVRKRMVEALGFNWATSFRTWK